jgi:hypothetical protein
MPKLFYIGSVSIALLLFIDFLIGGFFLPCGERNHLYVSRCYKNKLRVPHVVYHHDLEKNVRAIDLWGTREYMVCTDGNGFKISCNSRFQSQRSFDIAFIGDSFTEGVGLEYEETFIGQISKSRPDLVIANLGVSSYSPSIYFSKVKFLLEQGIFFKELVVYIDISDVQDEAISYELNDGIVVSKDKGEEVALSKFSVKRLAHWSFPLTYYGASKLKTRYFREKTVEVNNFFSANYERSSWTYNPASSGYGQLGVQGGVEQSLLAMSKLSELLRQRGINLSIGVYPWPGQLLYDEGHSQQVRIWEDFCRTNCVRFYNSFQSFFILKDKISADKTIELFFISGDIHHNRQGAEIIANDFLNAYEK